MTETRWKITLLALAASSLCACAPDVEAGEGLPELDEPAEEFMTSQQALLHGCPSAVITNPATAQGGWSSSSPNTQTWTLNGASVVLGAWWCTYGMPNGFVSLRRSSPSDMPDCRDFGNMFTCVHLIGCSGSHCTSDKQQDILCPTPQVGTVRGYVQNGQTVWGWPSNYYAGVVNGTLSHYRSYVAGGSASPGGYFRRNGQLTCESVVSPSGGLLVLGPS